MMRRTTDIEVLGPWAWKLRGSGIWHSAGKSGLGEVDDKGVPMWAIIFDNYEPGGSIHIHIAIDNPKYVSRRAISDVFEYPFCQLGVKKVLGIVNSNNYAALSFDLRLGFHVEAIISDPYYMGDMYILSMKLKQCRCLIGKEHGISIERTAAA